MICINNREEHEIQSQIMIDVSKHHCHIFRTNTGTVEMKRGGYFRAGPPSGFPDLTGFKDSNGKIYPIYIYSFFIITFKEVTLHIYSKSCETPSSTRATL